MLVLYVNNNDVVIFVQRQVESKSDSVVLIMSFFYWNVAIDFFFLHVILDFKSL